MGGWRNIRSDAAVRYDSQGQRQIFEAHFGGYVGDPSGSQRGHIHDEASGTLYPALRDSRGNIYIEQRAAVLRHRVPQQTNTKNSVPRFNETEYLEKVAQLSSEQTIEEIISLIDNMHYFEYRGRISGHKKLNILLKSGSLKGIPSIAKALRERIAKARDSQTANATLKAYKLLARHFTANVAIEEARNIRQKLTLKLGSSTTRGALVEAYEIVAEQLSQDDLLEEMVSLKHMTDAYFEDTARDALNLYEHLLEKLPQFDAAKDAVFFREKVQERNFVFKYDHIDIYAKLLNRLKPDDFANESSALTKMVTDKKPHLCADIIASIYPRVIDKIGPKEATELATELRKLFNSTKHRPIPDLQYLSIKLYVNLDSESMISFNEKEEGLRALREVRKKDDKDRARAVTICVYDAISRFHQSIEQFKHPNRYMMNLSSYQRICD